MDLTDYQAPDISEEEMAAAPAPLDSVQTPAFEPLPARKVNYKYYGAEVGDEDRPSTRNNATGGRLKHGDVAVSPDLLDQFPMGSYMAFQTKRGVEYGKVTDLSGVKVRPDGTTQWNHNTVETWNRNPGMDSGHAVPLTEEQLRAVIRNKMANQPERSKIAGDVTAASMENATAPDISADATSPDVTDALGTEAPQAAQSSSSEETAPIPSDLSKTQYDPNTKMVSWEFGGKQWYIAPGMKQPKPMPTGPQTAQPKYIKFNDGTVGLVNAKDPTHPLAVTPPTGGIESPKGLVATDEELANLQEVSPEKASLVDGIAKYELMGGARGATLPAQIQKMLPELLPYIKKVNPTFSIEKAGERRVFLNQQWASTNPNTAGGAKASANRLVQHMGEMADAYDALGNGDSSVKNYAKNLFSKTGPNRFEAAKTTAAILAQEAAKAVQGGAPNVAEIQRLVNGLSVNAAPETFKSTMHQIIGLVSDQLRTQGSNYRNHMGKDVPDQELIDPEAANSVIDLQKRGYYKKNQFGGRVLNNYFDEPSSVTYSKDSLPAGQKPTEAAEAAGAVINKPNEVTRPMGSGPYKGRSAVFDADTKKFLRWADE